ncbi:MAG: hypothetical protein F6K47_29575 [Symploca sp. SIO2E6]|nr:hypothetical protein [Symploca sp. SIO2E6]
MIKRRTQTKVFGNEIRIIGSRKAGKTTYLSALLRFPKELKRQFPGLKIIPMTQGCETLIEYAKNIIEQGAVVAGTDWGNEPLYAFEINIPGTKGLPGVTLELLVKDYVGEVFESIGQPHRQHIVEPYLEDWCSSQGWMIMLTDWQVEQDSRIYAPALKRLLEELNERARINEELKNLRVAVVMTKCERGELWPCRLDPEEDLFKVRLQETYRILKQKLPSSRCKFFACSAFGVLSDQPGDRDPRPNRYIPSDGSSPEFNTYLRNTSAWKPYGLISPIYWLSTGRMLNDESL